MSTHLDCDTDNPHPTSQGEQLIENVHVHTNDGKGTGEKEDESFSSGMNSLSQDCFGFTFNIGSVTRINVAMQNQSKVKLLLKVIP